MKFLAKLVQYAVLFSAVITTLFAMGVFSVLPVLLLRYFMLPEYEIVIPVDFVPKNVKVSASSLTGAGIVPHLVAELDMRHVSKFSSQDYAIDLDLKLPRSDVNLNMGNFMIRCALCSWRPQILNVPDMPNARISEKMGILPFRSHLIETLRLVVLSPLYIFGILSEESDISVPLWSQAESPKSSYLLLTLPAELMVSYAQLRFSVRLSGLRRLLQQYPMFTTIVGSSVVFTFELITTVTLVIMIYNQVFPKQPRLKYDFKAPNASIPAAARATTSRATTSRAPTSRAAAPRAATSSQDFKQEAQHDPLKNRDEDSHNDKTDDTNDPESERSQVEITDSGPDTSHTIIAEENPDRTIGETLKSKPDNDRNREAETEPDASRTFLSSSHHNDDDTIPGYLTPAYD